MPNAESRLNYWPAHAPRLDRDAITSCTDESERAKIAD